MITRKQKRGPTTSKECFEIGLCLLVECEIKRRKIGRDNVLRSVAALLTGLSHNPAMKCVYGIYKDIVLTDATVATPDATGAHESA